MQGPLSILVVDDEIDIGLILKQFLHRFGFKADRFTDPLLAFEHFKNSSNSYSLIITDISMQGMSGIDYLIKLEKKKV